MLSANLRRPYGVSVGEVTAVRNDLKPRPPTLGLVIRFRNDRPPQQRGATGPGIIGLVLRVQGGGYGIDIVSVKDPGADQMLKQRAGQGG